MNKITIAKIADIEATHKNDHDTFEYYKKSLVPMKHSNQCCISVYEIPPGKAAYPYHYHSMNEESFYIINGSGTLTTPSGDTTVSQGDFMFFPANESGAHILVNTSEKDPLIYLDFDTHNPIDVTIYPHSGKIGIWGKDINKVFRTSDSVDYYEGE